MKGCAVAYFPELLEGEVLAGIRTCPDRLDRHRPVSLHSPVYLTHSPGELATVAAVRLHAYVGRPIRYEVNPEKVAEIEAAGLEFVGRDETGTRMEIAELPRKHSLVRNASSPFAQFPSPPVPPPAPLRLSLCEASRTVSSRRESGPLVSSQAGGCPPRRGELASSLSAPAPGPRQVLIHGGNLGRNSG